MISDLDKEVLKLFGDHLKSLKLAKMLTYRKMSLNCNIDYGDIQKISNGKINITILTLIELANALDVEPKLLLEFGGVSSSID